jgi:hypothetical protein
VPAGYCEKWYKNCETLSKACSYQCTVDPSQCINEGLHEHVWWRLGDCIRCLNVSMSSPICYPLPPSFLPISPMYLRNKLLQDPHYLNRSLNCRFATRVHNTSRLLTPSHCCHVYAVDTYRNPRVYWVSMHRKCIIFHGSRVFGIAAQFHLFTPICFYGTILRDGVTFTWNA